MGGFIKNLIIDSFKGFDSMIIGAQNVLTQTNDSVWDNILQLSNILKPFCYTIIGICLLIEIAQVASKVDVMKWEHGLKVLVKMVLAKVCIDIAPVFLKACYMQAALWISSIGAGSNANLGTIAGQAIEPHLNELGGIFDQILLIAILGIVILAIKICGMLVTCVAYGRMFEIYVYLAVSPLPCAFFPLGDGSGGGFSRVTGRFFKSFAAVCLQGVMIVVCMKIFNVIMSNAFIEMIQAAASGNSEGAAVIADLNFTMLMAAVVLLMSVFKCGTWAKSILDAM